MLSTAPKRNLWMLAAVALGLAACSSAVSGNPLPTGLPPAAGSDPPQPIQEQPNSDEQQVDESGESAMSENPFAGETVRFIPTFWPDTDFSKRSIPLSEIQSGGQPPDGIPAIDNPIFESAASADEWLSPEMPVMFFTWERDARAYPLAILIWHEIVNDVVGGQPVALTFCPLCNSTIAFDRVLDDGTVLDFGTTGNLRNSDLVMYDRQSQSWWQQFTGEAIVGELTGTLLEILPSQIISWSDFKEQHPDGKVLSRETGNPRPYGRNPYPGYDTVGSSPFLFEGPYDGRLPAVERVVAITVEQVDVAYPFSLLSELQVVNDQVSEQPLVIFWQAGTSTTFGTASSDVGSTAVFLRTLGDGQTLTFEAAEQGYRDAETGSLWNVFGQATEGPLAGSQLDQVVSGEHFWFAWAAFKPDTLIRSTPPA